jgi:hypothetical protein
MFDWYEPVPPVPCPTCKSVDMRWQGKDGPSALFVWRQGARHPTRQDADVGARIDEDRLADFALPDHFRFWTTCPNGHELEAAGRCTDGVWSGTDLLMA